MATQSINFSATNLPAAGTFVQSAQVDTTLTALINDYNLQVGNNKIAPGAVGQSNILFESPTSYNPVWSASGTAPSIGNGTLTGKSFKYGPLTIVNIKLIAGSTTTFGTGEWAFSLPVTGTADTNIGTAFALNNGVAGYAGVAYQGSVSQITQIYGDGTAGFGPTVPFNWASTDQLNITLVFWSAS